jgi:hypothetical protein
MSFRAGKLVGTMTTSRRGAEKGAKSAGLRMQQIGRGTKQALEKAPQVRRELRLLRRELRAEGTGRQPVVAAGVAGVFLGLAGAYFLDPHSGERRRGLAKKIGSKLSRRRAPVDEGEEHEQPAAEEREPEASVAT